MRAILLTISLIIAAPAAYADKLGEHPALIARRVLAAQGYDYAAKFYPHPAWLYLSSEAPQPVMDDPAAVDALRVEQQRIAAIKAAAQAQETR